MASEYYNGTLQNRFNRFVTSLHLLRDRDLTENVQLQAVTRGLLYRSLTSTALPVLLCHNGSENTPTTKNGNDSDIQTGSIYETKHPEISFQQKR